MGKTKGKVCIEGSSKEQEEGATSCVGLPDGQLLCCVPQPLVECLQKVITDPKTAVKMGCTNLHCTSHRLIHPKCFARLEKHLVTAALRFKPKSRNWTDSQTLANVWNCRGQDILHKMCPCSCGGTLRNGEIGISLPKSIPKPVVRKKSRPTAFDASSAKADQRLTKFPYPELKADLSRLRKLYYSRSVSEPGAERFKEEDASRELFVYSIPQDSSKRDLLECFEKFGEVLKIWISSPPSYFGFVTFDSVESVTKALASVPIMLFGCHKLNVERKMPQLGSEGRTRNNDANQLYSCPTSSQTSSSALSSRQATGMDDPTLLSQDAVWEDLGPQDGCHSQETETSATPEIYWSDDEAEKGEVDLTDNSWSQEELLSNLTSILQAQAEMEQERLEWIEERRANEAEQLRLAEENKAQVLRLEAESGAQRLRLEAENQVLRDNLEMLKEQLRAKDARVRELEEEVMANAEVGRLLETFGVRGTSADQEICRILTRFYYWGIQLLTFIPLRLQHQKAELTKSSHEFGLEVSLLPGYPNVCRNPGGPVEVLRTPFLNCSNSSSAQSTF